MRIRPINLPQLDMLKQAQGYHMTLEATEAECAAVAAAKGHKPRVSLDDIKAAMAAVHYTTGDQAVGLHAKVQPSLRVLTICIVVMKNGFVIIGKSAPASEANFDVTLGRKLAYEDCVRQIWPLMGFALRDKLSNHVGEDPVYPRPAA